MIVDDAPHVAVDVVGVAGVEETHCLAVAILSSSDGVSHTPRHRLVTRRGHAAQHGQQGVRPTRGNRGQHSLASATRESTEASITTRRRTRSVAVLQDDPCRPYRETRTSPEKADHRHADDPAHG